MKKFKNFRVQDYLTELSATTPVPGGGSAAALTAALGAALIEMVAGYSLGKGLTARDERKVQTLLKKAGTIRQRLQELVDLDAQAYAQVVKTRKSPVPARRRALREAQKVPMEVAKLCYAAVDLTPVLVEKGNRFLLSDVEVALELLSAAFKAAMINVVINQI